MTPPNRQRNPALASRSGRLKLNVLEDAIRQASGRSRSPTSLSPISKDRSRRRSSSSVASNATESIRRHGNSRSGEQLNTLPFPDQPIQLQTQPPQSFSPSLSQQESSSFPPFPFDESDEPPSQGQSPVVPVAQPSGHNLNWQLTAQPLQTLSRAQSAKVKDGQMIRITLKTQTTEVPCIAKCYLNRALSVVDNDFARNWNIKIHPVPKSRWKDAKHWCVLDVIDVETVGSLQQQLRIRLGKLPDQRFSVELGIDALKSLHLVDEVEAVSPLSRSAPPSQYPSWADINPSSSYMQPQQQQQQLQGSLGQYMFTSPTPQQFNPGRNRALTVPSGIPLIRIDTSFDNSLPVPMPLCDSGSGEDSSSPWDALSLASQSFQDDDRSVWSPAISECGGHSSSYDTCMK
ncbi:3-ketoacyl- peroxisomal [Fusarium langsethiae]|uniref:3-ketoacyl-peroxisomal n=1 Tax=Fusarium langsethiae TaxID=179993 RepID=A0A0N0V8Q4_FUSLA|nr:3-ketoacyl- peroxisomal [Fusarium langsethiae]GKT98831.1 unnamed protein product [Fusarium langsethiae]GKU17335.1 unnamed protein product [Fusarium langsethiae]